MIAALEPGRTWWTAVLDAVRLGPDDDDIAVTAAQVRDVVTPADRCRALAPGDPAILVVFDVGYDIPRLSFLLADLPAEVLGRLRRPGDAAARATAPAWHPRAAPVNVSTCPRRPCGPEVLSRSGTLRLPADQQRQRGPATGMIPTFQLSSATTRRRPISSD